MKKTMALILLLVTPSMQAIEPVVTAIVAGAVGGVTCFISKKILQRLRGTIAVKADKTEYDACVASIALKNEIQQKLLDATRSGNKLMIEELQGKNDFFNVRNELIALLVQHARGPKNAEGIPVAANNKINEVRQLIGSIPMKVFLAEVQAVVNQRIKAHA